MKLPYGYTQTPNGEIAIKDCHAEVVRLIYQQYIAGASLGKIVEVLFEKQIPSPSGNPKWTRAAVDNTLKNGKYVPLIISMENFTKVQFKRAARSNFDENANTRKITRYSSQNVLSGLLICPECGANYRRITKPSGEAVWRCASKVETAKSACKNAPTVSDKAVKAMLCKLLDMAEFDEEIVRNDVEAICIQSDGSFDVQYKVEPMQIMEY